MKVVFSTEDENSNNSVNSPEQIVCSKSESGLVIEGISLIE